MTDTPASTPVQVLLEHRADFLRYLERQLGDDSAAEDVLQEVLTRAVTRADELRDPGAVIGWFYRLLRNAATDHHRRRASAGRALEALAAAPAHDAPEALEGKTCQCVKRLAAGLKPEYATALQRIEVEDVPVKDYAEEAGITSTNAGVRVFRAREALRKQVHRTCGACAQRGCMDCTCSS